jgi:hypothetical protein
MKPGGLCCSFLFVHYAEARMQESSAFRCCFHCSRSQQAPSQFLNGKLSPILLFRGATSYGDKKSFKIKFSIYIFLNPATHQVNRDTITRIPVNGLVRVRGKADPGQELNSAGILKVVV